MLTKICCLHTDLCKCHCFGLTRNKNVKLGYIAITLLSILAIILLNATADTTDRNVIAHYRCSLYLDSFGVLPLEEACVRDKNSQVVFLAVGSMHLVLFGLMFLHSDRVKIINQGGWLIKILVVALLIFLWRLMVGTAFFQWLCIGSSWLSSVVYLIEGLVLVDLVYALDCTFDEHSRDNTKCPIFKVVLTLLVLAGAIVMVYLNFVNNQLWISWTYLIFFVLSLLVAVLRVFRQNSILVAVLVSLLVGVFACYLFPQSEKNTVLFILKGVFLGVLLFGMLTQGSNMVRTRKSSINQALALNTTPNEEDNRYVSSNKWTVYHFIMVVILLGIPGVFCWQEKGNLFNNETSIQIGRYVGWAACGLWYLWSLVAMKIFPSEDFSDLENYFREYELK